jgi:hypothetical protein
VTLTLFSWDDIPAKRYSANTARFSGSSDLGLLTIATDQGIEGNAFLGSAWSPASQDGPKLIRYLKPLIMEKNPLGLERLYHAMWSRSRTASIPAIGAIDIGFWDIAGRYLFHQSLRYELPPRLDCSRRCTRTSRSTRRRNIQVNTFSRYSS